MIKLNAAYTAKEIIKTISKYNYVSFDVFDTLIRRAFASPKDLFIRVAEDFSLNNKIKIDPIRFQRDRIFAAGRAREFSKNNGFEETTLEEIYSFFPDSYKDLCDDLKALEIQREYECCIANPEIKKVFDWCIANKKTVFIISDMYLSKNVIEKILLNCGYKGYKELYVSSDVKLKKRTGRLYNYFIKKENLKCDSVIHIGDNFLIDYIYARKNKLNSLYISKDVNRSIFCSSSGLKKENLAEYKKFRTIIENNIDLNWNIYYRYGFEAIGMLLYGFCSWLHEELLKQKCDKVFFLSRDGYLMQKAYNMMFADNCIENDYLYVSRKSLTAPQFCFNPTLSNVFEGESSHHYWNFEEICTILNIDSQEHYCKWMECGLDNSSVFLKKQLLSDDRINSFFETVKNDLISSSKQKYEIVKKYFEQKSFVGNVAIVDIGWAGTIQKCIQCFTEKDEKINIFGYYMGLKEKTVTGKNAVAFIPDTEKPSLFCSQLFEYPFTKCEGSTLSYECGISGEVSPILSAYEFKDKFDYEYTKCIQEGALDFIKLVLRGYSVKKIDYLIAYNNFKSIAKCPSMEQVAVLGNLAHVNRDIESKLAAPQSLFFYLKNFKKLKYDFSLSGWKVGFLKKIFKISLPYYKILTFVRRLLS